jgi:hypothetical protein
MNQYGHPVPVFNIINTSIKNNSQPGGWHSQDGRRNLAFTTKNQESRMNQ